MGEFFVGTEKVRIDFPNGEWCEVKEELTQEDSDYISNQMTKMTSSDGKSPQVNIKLGRLPLLARSIVAWSFVDEAKNPIPLTTENISRLRAKYRHVILQKIDELNQEAQDFSKKS